MKKIGCFLIIIGISLVAFYHIYNYASERKENQNVEDYINETSQIKNDITDEETNEGVKEENINKSINYTAVLEIPKINLKRGVVDNTKNFKSINYAISVDGNSNYPNEKGNFILYAHSGSSNISFFRNLNLVDVDDNIYVYFNGVKYHYVIYKKYDIEKVGKAKIINSSDEQYITLITCNPDKKNYQIVLVGRLKDSLNY